MQHKPRKASVSRLLYFASVFRRPTATVHHCHLKQCSSNIFTKFRSSKTFPSLPLTQHNPSSHPPARDRTRLQRGPRVRLLPPTYQHLSFDTSLTPAILQQRHLRLSKIQPHRHPPRNVLPDCRSCRSPTESASLRAPFSKEGACKRHNGLCPTRWSTRRLRSAGV